MLIKFIKIVLWKVAKRLSYIQDARCLKVNNINRWAKFAEYRVINKSLWDFRPLRYSSWDGYAEGKHVNRGRDTPSFCPTLQVLDMSTLENAADVNPVIKFLPHTCNVCGRNLIKGLTSAASPRVDIGRIETWSVSPSVDMLPLDVTIPATVPQRSDFLEGLMNYMNYPVFLGSGTVPETSARKTTKL